MRTDQTVKYVAVTGFVLGLFFVPGVEGVASAQTTAVAAEFASDKSPAGAAKISYERGQLKINAQDVTLADVLNRVAALTGAKIDLPPGASDEKMPLVELGPGPTRQILATLLGDTKFDYLIQGAEGDPGKVRSVLVMTREKNSGGSMAADLAGRGRRSPFSRGIQATSAPEEPSATENVVVVQSENPPTDPAPPNPQPPPAAQPDVPLTLPPSSQLTPLEGARPGALAPPSSLTTQGINTQLQQMYQQRLQMIQQQRTQSTPPAANSGNN